VVKRRGDRDVNLGVFIWFMVIYRDF
jgi:hypothetical protein